MNIDDLLIMVIAAAILVAVAVGIVTYLAYRIRGSGRPGRPQNADDDTRFFVRYHPGERSDRDE